MNTRVGDLGWGTLLLHSIYRVGIGAAWASAWRQHTTRVTDLWGGGRE